MVPCACAFPFLSVECTNKAWVETEHKQWQEVEIVYGIAQRDTSSTPSFTRGFRMALDKVPQRLLHSGIWVHLASLVDDMLLVTDPCSVDYVVEIIVEELADI